MLVQNTVLKAARAGRNYFAHAHLDTRGQHLEKIRSPYQEIGCSSVILRLDSGRESSGEFGGPICTCSFSLWSFCLAVKA